jgi:multiple sugar transport system permease protein
MAQAVVPLRRASVSEGEFKRSHQLFRLGLYSAAIVLSLLFLGPFIWAALSSFKSDPEIYRVPPSLFPDSLRWSNYVLLFELEPFARFYLNSVLITLGAAIGTLLSCTVVAYGFARFGFPGRRILFYIVIATLILPPEATLVTRFLLFRELGWLNTFLPLIVPHYFAVNAFAIFLLRQFFMGIPRDLDEAAMIDGAGALQILWRVLLPQLRPALSAVAIFSFLASWNDFIHPLIFLTSKENYTLAVGLRFFLFSSDRAQGPLEAYLMGAAMLISLPPIVLFILAQRYFIQGIMLSSGSKG